MTDVTADISQIARRHDLSTGQIYTWRRKLLDASATQVPASSDPGFAEAVMVEDGPSARAYLLPVIIVDLARGRRLNIFASPSLALMVQQGLKRDPRGGDLYVFRSRAGALGRSSGATGSASRFT